MFGIHKLRWTLLRLEKLVAVTCMVTMVLSAGASGARAA
jgi:hypothetical protein